ncbi:MAG: glycine cleavage system aminomethyltransferase GcvT [Gammaproteobacteria bacterium TMED112]|nr:MAG: glycine cleavage system aminomethyltransferase GcvT [Gammaproteobacteria bacterium TMED112]|tara:strand:+ start:18961 stop:20004 length:1044 start_codon:yes stop_codon:yes gene_type:complete
MNKTYLNDFHRENKGNLVDFAGWEMPINYGSQINEHNLVRTDVGIFDVSHMAVFDLHGSNQTEFLKYLIPNDVTKILDSKKALYSPLLNESGGILDDLIIYHLGNGNFRIISNCGTREQNSAWFKKIASAFDVRVDFKSDASIIALQGPNSIKNLSSLYDLELKKFHLFEDDDIMIARTGYTGELGVEIISNATKGLEIWEHLISKNVQPIGLAARDTLRLEAGFNLYGSDMTIENNPYDSNLEWTVDQTDEERNYIGKKALNHSKESENCLVGFYTGERGVLRSGTKVSFEAGEGVITSGTWSPTFKKNIGFCRISKNFPATGKSFLRDKEINLHFCETNFLKYLK